VLKNDKKWQDQGYKANIKTTLYTMIKVCIFNKRNDVSRFAGLENNRSRKKTIGEKCRTIKMTDQIARLKFARPQ